MGSFTLNLSETGYEQLDGSCEQSCGSIKCWEVLKCCTTGDFP